MGTPEIAAGILRSLIASRHEVVGVVTQPDRPNARGNEIIFSDVKKVALEYSIPVFQPEKASEETFVESIRELAPDIIVVAAYGQILRENILNLPKYRCINVHASILPKYRGASPIQWAVINGEKETGITIMYMEKGLENPAVLVDTNHANSNKNFREQKRIAEEVLHSCRYSKDVRSIVKGLMIESYIEEGSQTVGGGVYGKSITDPCLGWKDTEELIYRLAERL